MNFVACAFRFSVRLAAVYFCFFHSPKHAHVVYCCTATAISIAIEFCIDFTKNGAFSFVNTTTCSSVDSQLQTSCRACAIAQIVCGPLLRFHILHHFAHVLPIFATPRPDPEHDLFVCVACILLQKRWSRSVCWGWAPTLFLVTRSCDKLCQLIFSSHASWHSRRRRGEQAKCKMWSSIMCSLSLTLDSNLKMIW